MPSFPKLGDGLIRSHDLLEALRDDVYIAYAELEQDRLSQFKRRCVVHSIFSFIEAAIECIKVEIRSTVRANDLEAMLTDKDEETLETTALIYSRPTKFLPLHQNIKRTFKLAAKVWEVDFQLATDIENFQSFVASKRARDLLTHPRTYYDIEVTDIDMHHYSVACEWFRHELQRLFHARVESLMKGLSEQDANVFHQVFGRSQ